MRLSRMECVRSRNISEYNCLLPSTSRGETNKKEHTRMRNLKRLGPDIAKE